MFRQCYNKQRYCRSAHSLFYVNAFVSKNQKVWSRQARAYGTKTGTYAGAYTGVNAYIEALEVV